MTQLKRAKSQMKNDETKELSEVLDFNKPSFVFKPKEHHDWKQKGPYLVCKSCEIEHAVWIGMDKIMVGINKEGKPILKKRSEVRR